MQMLLFKNNYNCSNQLAILNDVVSLWIKNFHFDKIIPITIYVDASKYFCQIYDISIDKTFN